VGATAALLLVGGGAGVLALVSPPTSSTVRTTPADDNDRALLTTLPPVTDPRDTADTGEPAAPTTATAPIPATPVELAPVIEGQPAIPEPPEATPKPGPISATPAPDEPPTTPATTAAPAPVAPAGPTSQVLTSACGDVVVEIDQRTVKITSLAPLPGYASQVSTDGPNSVEMKFLGSRDSCEVHAELKPSGLDIEIQQSGEAG